MPAVTTAFLSPVVRQQAFKLGISEPLAKLYTYLSGSSTPYPVYLDADLQTEAANPLVADSSGRFAPFWLGPVTYRMTMTDTNGATIGAAVDGIANQNVEAPSAQVDGTYDETISAGETLYLSAGSPGVTAGRWGKGDASTGYSSTFPQMGMALEDGVAGESHRIMLSGEVTVAGPLVAGATYYVSETAGAVTTTPPGNLRVFGQALSTTRFLVGAPRVVINACDGQLVFGSILFG